MDSDFKNHGLSGERQAPLGVEQSTWEKVGMLGGSQIRKKLHAMYTSQGFSRE